MTRAVFAITVGLCLTGIVGGCGGPKPADPASGVADRAVTPKPPGIGTSVAGTGAVPTHAQVMAQSAQMWPEYTLTCAGVPFTLGVDEGDGHGTIRYISTTDGRFITPDGVHVGSDYRAVMTASGGRAAIAERGWGYYVELPSGWCAAFAQGPGLADGELRPDATVGWVFQRIGYGAPPATQPGQEK